MLNQEALYLINKYGRDLTVTKAYNKSRVNDIIKYSGDIYTEY
jgi:hypothetical protein